MDSESTSESITPQTIISEGVRIAGIALFWGVLAALSRYGIGNFGYARPGQLLFEIGNYLALLFVVTGVASVFLYVIARSIQLSDR